MDTLNKVLYTAKTHTTGGRDGAARSSDGRLDVRLTSPGAAGAGTNPEQLFAAGWSACYLGAMGVAAQKLKVTLPADRAVDAEVDLGTRAHRHQSLRDLSGMAEQILSAALARVGLGERTGERPPAVSVA